MTDKIYDIEYIDDYWGRKYRFRSLYNGAVGSWCNEKKKALEQGEKHEKIINKIIEKGG